jgi:hypothetical protein
LLGGSEQRPFAGKKKLFPPCSIAECGNGFS